MSECARTPIWCFAAALECAHGRLSCFPLCARILPIVQNKSQITPEIERICLSEICRLGSIHIFDYFGIFYGNACGAESHENLFLNCWKVILQPPYSFFGGQNWVSARFSPTNFSLLSCTNPLRNIVIATNEHHRIIIFNIYRDIPTCLSIKLV